MKDYYKVLELKTGATETEIKKAYRNLAQKYHPDKNFGNKKYEEIFKEINEAYATLSDIESKRVYDIKYQNYFYTQANSSNNNKTTDDYKTNTKQEYKQTDNTKNESKKETIMTDDTFSNKVITHLKAKYVKYVLLIVVVAVGIYLYKLKDINAYYSEKEKKEKYEKFIASVQESKKFDDRDLTQLKIPRVTLETRWKDNLMYYKFHLIGKSNDNNSYKRNSNDTTKNDLYFETRVKTIEKITILFLDKDGYKIYTLPISISDMTRNVDNEGIANGYSINSNIPMKPELYKDFENWNIEYTLN